MISRAGEAGGNRLSRRLAGGHRVAVEPSSEPSGTARVAALFSTFNRKESALGCLDRLRGQTRPPDLVVVADNGSGDGTWEELERLAAGWGALRRIRLPDNPGNGAAVAAAMRVAMGEGADWMWVLDDDSWPLPEALEKLLAHAGDPAVALASLVVARGSGELAWPLMLREPGGGERVVRRVADFGGGPTAVIRGGWLGGLVSREVVGRVGLPEAAFFLRGEDEDYNSRFLAAGIATRCVLGSLLEHPKPQIRQLTLFGKHLFYEPGLAPWKLYYTVRNRAWLRMRHARSRAAGALNALGYIALNAACAMVLEGRKRERLAAVLGGGRDAFAGRLGKTVEPG